MTAESLSPLGGDAKADADIPAGVRVAEAPLVVVPTTEQLVDLEKEIQRLVERKRWTDLHIIDLEARIHAVETEYLRETAQFGSIATGLEGYLDAGASTAQTPSSARRGAAREVRDCDRLFSSTSSSHQRVAAPLMRPDRIRRSPFMHVSFGSAPSMRSCWARRGGKTMPLAAALAHRPQRRPPPPTARAENRRAPPTQRGPRRR